MVNKYYAQSLNQFYYQINPVFRDQLNSLTLLYSAKKQEQIETAVLEMMNYFSSLLNKALSQFKIQMRITCNIKKLLIYNFDEYFSHQVNFESSNYPYGVYDGLEKALELFEFYEGSIISLIGSGRIKFLGIQHLQGKNVRHLLQCIFMGLPKIFILLDKKLQVQQSIGLLEQLCSELNLNEEKALLRLLQFQIEGQTGKGYLIEVNDTKKEKLNQIIDSLSPGNFQDELLYELDYLIKVITIRNSPEQTKINFCKSLVQLISPSQGLKNEHTLRQARRYLLNSDLILIVNQKGTQTLKFDEQNIDRLIESLELVVTYFKSQGFLLLSLKAQQRRASLYKLSGNLQKAKQIMESVIEEISRLDYKKEEAKCRLTLKLILQQLVNKQQNLFTFLIAYPLADSLAFDDKWKLNNFTRINNDFKPRMLQSLKATNSQISVNFDVLSRKTFSSELQKQQKILFLSSDLHQLQIQLYKKNVNDLIKNHLEAKDNIDVLTLTDLEEEMNKAQILIKQNIDVIILGFPASKKVIESFQNACKVLLYFEFSDGLTVYKQKDIQNVKKVQSFIFDFTILFIDNLLNKNTFEDGFFLAMFQFQKRSDEINESFLQGDQNYLTPKLLSQKHQKSFLFPDQAENSFISDSSLINDLSAIRGPINFKKHFSPFVGKKSLMFKVIRSLLQKNVSIYHLRGKSGIGKSRLMQEIGYYLFSRSYYLGGIFYLDVKKAFSVDFIIQKFANIQARKQNLNSESQKILLLLDGVDNILHNDSVQFQWYIHELIANMETNRSNIQILMSTSGTIDIKNIQQNSSLDTKDQDQNVLQQFNFTDFLKDKEIRAKLNVQIAPLQDKEIAEFVAANSTKFLDKNELQKLEDPKFCINKGIILAPLRGFPKYLKKLAQIMQAKSLEEINLKDYIKKKTKTAVEVEQAVNEVKNDVESNLKQSKVMKTGPETQLTTNFEMDSQINSNNGSIMTDSISSLYGSHSQISNYSNRNSQFPNQFTEKRNEFFDFNEAKSEQESPGRFDLDYCHQCESEESEEFLFILAERSFAESFPQRMKSKSSSNTE